MFERFTERARQVIVFAQDEARALKHGHIDTEHLLLGLLREEDGVACRVLESLYITVEEVRAQVARIVGQGDTLIGGQIPFTPRAKKVLELSLREALSLGHNYIGTEHILLGLTRENEGVAARILLDFDADFEKIRNETIRTLSRPSRRHPRVPDPPNVEYTPSRYLELAEEIVRLREEMEQAFEAGDSERAADLGERVSRLEGIQSDLESEPSLRSFAVSPTIPLYHVPTPSVPTHTIVRIPSLSWLLFGWALFGAALGIGILVGWLIWG